MAYENDVLTRNDNDELAVRTVQTTGDNPGAYDDIYTRDNNGKLCVRVTGTGGGGGGSDPHNLGWYATQSALETAHPTAEDGDWAIVGSTDTVWVWDSDNNEWKDTDQKGQVESVNGQTGTVVLTASDVGAATTAQGAKADTAVQPGDLATVATSGSYDDLTDKPTIPAAQVNSDWNAVSGVAQILNKPTLGTAASANTTDFATAAQGALAATAVQPGDLATVATTGNYSDLSGTPTIPTVGDGTITITQGGVTKGTFTTNQSGNTTIDVDAGGGGSGLPDQTGKGGRFLATDGTDASWSDNIQITGSSGAYGILSIGVDTDVSPSTSYGGIGIGHKAKVTGQHGISIGTNATTAQGISIGQGTSSATNGISIGGGSAPNGGIHIGMNGTNSTQNTMTVSLGSGWNWYMYTLLNSDGTIPTARLTKVNTTITLTAAGWSSNTQTVSVTGMTATGVVLVSPAPADQSAYTSAGILCTAQAAGTLTFTCDTVPSGDLSVNVVML